jgi:RNA polymerase sigma factor (sigma-70 family)
MMQDKNYEAEFRDFFDEKHDTLFKIANFIVANPGDILQNVYMKVHLKREMFAAMQPDEVDRLLYKMVKSECIDELRRGKAMTNSAHGFGQLLAADDVFFQDAAEINAEMMERLRTAMKLVEKLPKKSQEVIKAVFIEGMTIREYADKFGISVRLASKRKARAIAKGWPPISGIRSWRRSFLIRND